MYCIHALLSAYTYISIGEKFAPNSEVWCALFRVRNTKRLTANTYVHFVECT